MYIYGGCVDQFDKNKVQLRKVIQIYDCCNESWKEVPTSDTPPHGIYGCATAYSNHILYLFGGYEDPDPSYSSSLHQLDTRSMIWTQLSPQHASGPMRKSLGQMIYYNNSLVVIGGYGIQSGGLQSGSWITNSSERGRCYTNEIHMYSISQGKVISYIKFIDCTVHVVYLYKHYYTNII